MNIGAMKGAAMLRLSLGTKLVSGIVLAIFLILLAGATAILQLQQLSQQTVNLAATAQASQYAHAIQLDLQKLHAALAEGSARQNVEWFHQPLTQPKSAIDTNVASLIRLLREQGKTAQADTIAALHSTLTSEITTMVDPALAGDWNTSYLRLANQVEPTQAQLETQIQTIDRELQQDIAATTETVQTTEGEVFRNLGLVTSSALVILGLMGWLLWRSLVMPMRNLTDTATAVAHGNLAARAVASNRRDELGVLASTFNAMAKELEASHRTLTETVDTRTAELEAERAALQQTLADLQFSTVERERLLATLEQLQNPIIPVIEGVLVAPIVGQVSSQRLDQLQTTILEMVINWRARIVLLDITGVPVLDDQAASGLIRISQALQLLGARAVLVGIRPEVAQSLVSLGAESQRMTTTVDLQRGIDLALRTLRRQIVPLGTPSTNTHETTGHH